MWEFLEIIYLARTGRAHCLCKADLVLVVCYKMKKTRRPRRKNRKKAEERETNQLRTRREEDEKELEREAHERRGGEHEVKTSKRVSFNLRRDSFCCRFHRLFILP